jgi:hypothetical protein
VTDSYGNPLDDVYLYANGVFASRTSGGHYFITGLIASTYTISAEQWPIVTPSQYTITVPPMPLSHRHRATCPPVILVHGYRDWGITIGASMASNALTRDDPHLWDQMPRGAYDGLMSDRPLDSALFQTSRRLWRQRTVYCDQRYVRKTDNQVILIAQHG